MPRIDMRKVRGVLAQEQISRAQFAQACGLSRCYLSHVLNGAPAGELALLKIQRGLIALNLQEGMEVARAS